MMGSLPSAFACYLQASFSLATLYIKALLADEGNIIKFADSNGLIFSKTKLLTGGLC